MLNKLTPRPWLFWLTVAILGVIIVVILTDNSKDAVKLDYSEFLSAARAGHVESVEVRELDLRGKFKESYAKKQNKGQVAFKTIGPIGEDLQEELVAKNVSLSFAKVEDNGKWQMFVIQMVFILLLVVAFIFFMRQFQGNNGKAMTFGKSKAKLLNENQNKVTFSDIAGIDEAKEELQEVVEFLRSPKKFTRLGGRIPKGVLLMGSPGTGKTLLARGVAGEAGVPFFSIAGSDFVEMFVGVGASRVRDLFEQAKKHAPCIVFIDEIDAVGRSRGQGLGGGHDEREQTLNQLLVEMDGFEASEGVIIIAATNRPDVLDSALMRPGRFDRRVVVAAPDVRGREHILKIHTRRTPIARSVDLKKLAKGTPGFSGADLENLVNEAALLAARKDKDRVDVHDFEEAKDKVLMGAERKSAIIGPKERRLTAYHESGHAIVALKQDKTDPVHKVTIIPRGRALGVTQQLPDEDRYTVTKQYALQRIAVLMGGRAAEEIIYDEITSGAGNDIEVATDTARKMVCEWGMSEKIGPMRYAGGNTNPFLSGGGQGAPAPYSEEKARQIDEEIHEIITMQYAQAMLILNENRDLLELMTEALLELETIDTEDIRLLVEHMELEPLRQKRQREEAERQEPTERAPKTGFSSKIKDQINDLAKPTVPDNAGEAF